MSPLVCIAVITVNYRVFSKILIRGYELLVMMRCRLRIGFRQSQSRQLADGERRVHSTNFPSYSIVLVSLNLRSYEYEYIKYSYVQ